MQEQLIQVRYRSFLLYSLPAEGRSSPSNDITQYLRQEESSEVKSVYSGQMTAGAQKRMKKAVDLLCQIAIPEKIYNPVIQQMVWHTLSFITLTISSRERQLNAKEGNKLLLEPFLRVMRNKHGLNSYIWKAEFQKNGQLHYHVTTTAWIHYSVIRNTWNNILSKNGLTSKWDYSKGREPNSTDVHSVYKQADIAKYLAKYMSKISKDIRADSKIWDCSLNLKRAGYFTVPYPTGLYFRVPSVDIYESDHFVLIKHRNPIELLPSVVAADYLDYLSIIRNFRP